MYIYIMNYNVIKVNEELISKLVTQKGERRFYVYLHKKISNNEIFYVGKGTRYRCCVTHSRSKYWRFTALKYGVKVEIHSYSLTNEESCQLEKDIISDIGLSNLVNFSSGGDIGAIGENNHFYKANLTGDKNGNYGNKYDKNPLSIPILCFDLAGKFIKRYASAKQAELDGFYNNCIAAVCNKKRKSHKDHIFIKESEYNPDKDILFVSKTAKKQITAFTKDGAFIKTYSSIRDTEKDGFNPRNVSQVINGKKKSHFNIIFKHHKI